MANDNSSNKDLQDLLNVLNDFTLTVLSPVPNNSSLLSLWYKFKPLLAPESFDPLKIQSFISNIDFELAQPSVRKPPLSAKYPSETPAEPLKDVVPSRGESFYSNELNNKKSGNSTSSNSGVNLNFQNSMDTLPTDLSLKNDFQYYHSKSDKVAHNQSIEAQTFRRDSVVRGSLSKETHTTTRPQYNNTSIQDQSLDIEETRRVSKKYEANLEVLGRIASEGKQEAIKGNPMIQRSGDDSHPDPPTPPNDRISLGESQTDAKCPRALDFISKILNKPYSTISNHVIYAKLYVNEAKITKNTFYNSLIIAYFLNLLSDRSTSLALSNLYEKIVIRKIKLNHYPNHEKLYESLTTSLKAIIKEKIAKPGQTKILQELFLTKFTQDENLRLGLVAAMKEQLIDYAAIKDSSLFRQTGFENFAANVRTSSEEPTEEMIAAFPYIVEGNIEVHYIKSDKIEIVLYNQKAARSFKQTLFSLICSQVNVKNERNTFQVLVNKDQAELLEKFDIHPCTEELHEVPELQDTVYMSLDSIVDDPKENYIEDKVLEKETKQVKKPTPKKLPNKVKQISFIFLTLSQAPTLNKDFLLAKVKDLTQFMSTHTEKISDLFNPAKQAPKKSPPNNNTGQAQTTRYAVPTTIPQDNATSARQAKNQGFPEPIPNPSSFRQNPPSINNPPAKNAKPLAYKDTSYKINFPINNLPHGNTQQAESSRPSLGYYTGPMAATMDNKAGTARAYMGNNQNNTSVLNNTMNITLNSSLNSTPKRESKNTLEVEKENKDIGPLRSPLKRIVVYGHQKDAVFAGVEKEANLLEEVIRKSPKLANGPDRLIYEDSAV